MLHSTRRHGTPLLSFEKGQPSKKNPGRMRQREVGRLVTVGGVHCTLCGSLGHTEWQCEVAIDTPAVADPAIPIGAIGAFERPKPAVPIEEYRGPGRVLMLAPGVFGEDLAAAKITDAARESSKAARNRRAQGAARTRWGRKS